MAAASVTGAPRALVAPDSSIADSARLALATGVTALKHYETAAMAGEVEPVHQMRVTVRRLRATVRLFATVIHGARKRIYERELKWLGQAAGGVRDCDVMAELLRDCSAHLDPTLAESLTPVVKALAARRDAELSRFVDDLRTKRYTRMCERLADPLVRRALPAIDVGCYAPAMIAPIARQVRTAAKRITAADLRPATDLRGDPPAMIAPIAHKVRKAGKRIAAADVPPALFHRLRVRVKRLRYAFEMLPGMCGKRSRKALARLEQMQELLGAHQDLVAMLAWLRDYGGGAHDVAPETLMAVGALVQTLGDRRRKLAAQTYRRWRKVARAGVIKDALNEISRLAQRRLESNREAQAEAEYQAQAEADRQKQTQTEADRQAKAENEHPAKAENEHPAQAEAERQLPTASTADADALPCAPPNHVTAEAVASVPGASTPPPPSDDANAAALDDAVESTPAHHHNHD
jgi:CHAD domain-containing protein